MKKILTIIAFFTFTFTLCMNISYAQTTQDKAQEIQAAGQEAEQSQSATETRNINDSEWSNAEQGSGTPDMEHSQTVDIISNNEDTPPQDEPSTFDKPETEDATPWRIMLISMTSAFMSAMVLLTIGAAIIGANRKQDAIRNADIGRYRLKIGTILCSIAAALCAAVIGIAVTIMVKYNQYLLGGIWAGLGAMGVAACIATILLGRHAQYEWITAMYDTLVKRTMIIGLLLAGIGLAGGAAASYYSYKTNADMEAKKYCEQNPDDANCKSQNVVPQEPIGNEQ